jgi:multiple antibiotic resistance protein
MDNLFFSMAISLFLLMDPIGNVPIYLSILKEIPPKRQMWITFRELVIALFIIVGFYFLGEYLLLLLQVKQYTVMISGGIILFIIALRMIFPVHVKESPNGFSKDKEPLIVPLAIPLVAGPAVLAAVMLYSHLESIPTLTALMAIFCAWVVTTLILVASAGIKKIIGMRGILALERLMGLLLTLIAVQMFLQGLKSFLSS